MRGEHTCNSCTILRVKIRIDLVEQVEWCGIAFLDGEDWRS